MAPRKKAEDTSTEAQVEEPTTTDAPAEETERQKRARLLTAAKNALIERHRDEFNGLAEGLFGAEGLEFRRKLTPEEKAEQELAKLLESNPGLRSKLGNYAGEQHEGSLNLTRTVGEVDAYGTAPAEDVPVEDNQPAA